MGYLDIRKAAKGKKAANLQKQSTIRKGENMDTYVLIFRNKKTIEIKANRCLMNGASMRFSEISNEKIFDVIGIASGVIIAMVKKGYLDRATELSLIQQIIENIPEDED